MGKVTRRKLRPGETFFGGGSGVIIGSGGIARDLHAQKAHHQLKQAIEALISAEPDEVPEHVQKTREALERLQRYSDWHWSLYPSEPRPVAVTARLEFVSNDLLSPSEVDELEKIAFNQHRVAHLPPNHPARRGK